MGTNPHKLGPTGGGGIFAPSQMINFAVGNFAEPLDFVWYPPPESTVCTAGVREIRREPGISRSWEHSAGVAPDADEGAASAPPTPSLPSLWMKEGLNRGPPSRGVRDSPRGAGGTCSRGGGGATPEQNGGKGGEQGKGGNKHKSGPWARTGGGGGDPPLPVRGLWANLGENAAHNLFYNLQNEWRGWSC